MAKRITIIQGHPDPVGNHLLHTLADAYAEAAIRAGHELRRIEVAKLEFPLLRTQQEFENGTVPPALTGPQATCGGQSIGFSCFRYGTGQCPRS